MGWYNHTKNKLFRKEANASDFAANGLRVMEQLKLHPMAVAKIFTGQMRQELGDPSWNDPQLQSAAAGGKETLTTYLRGMSGGVAPIPPAQGLRDMPNVTEEQGVGNIPNITEEQGVGDMPRGVGNIPNITEDQGAGDMPGGLENIPDIPGDEAGEFGDTHGELGNIPSTELGDIPEEEGGGLDLSSLPEFGGMDMGMGDPEPTTEVARNIQENANTIIIEESENDVPDEERADPYEEMQLNIGADDIEHVERVNVEYISQKRFSIPSTYKIPDDNLAKLQGFIDKINKSKYSTGDSPVNIRYLTPPTGSRSNILDRQGADEIKPGIPTVGNQPAKYLKDQTNRMGENVDIDYVDFVIDGELPNPEGNPMKKDPRGKAFPDKEVVYHIIGSVQLYNIEGYAPEEEKFITPEEAKRHAAMKNKEEKAYQIKNGLSEPDRVWDVGDRLKSAPFAKLHKDSPGPESKGWCFPSRYTGRWRTLVQKYPGSPIWDREYDSNTPLQCDHCGTKKRGGSARKGVYIAIEFPAKDLWIGNKKDANGVEIPKTGKQIKPTTLPNWQEYPQVWIGKKCVGGQADALKFLKNLEKFKELMMGAEKTGRMSDSFGGSMQSSKGIPRIMGNYFEANVGRKNWYANSMPHNDIDVFKRYYFGTRRSEMYKASVAQHNWEQAKDKYENVDVPEYEDDVRIYGLLLNDWKRRGRPGNPPEKPKKPKHYGSKPDGPLALPWGTASEENMQKAKKIIQWWKDQKDGPLDNHNIEDVNYFGMNGTETHNLITVAAAGEVDTHLFKYIPDLIKGYNKHVKALGRIEEEKTRAQGERTRLEEGRGAFQEQVGGVGGVEDAARQEQKEFNLRRIREQQEVAGTAEMAARQEDDAARAAQEREDQARTRTEQLGAQGITLDNMSDVGAYQNFKSELKYVGSRGTNTGTMHTLKDERGNDYVFWDKHISDGRDPEPQYNVFQPGGDYIISGKKGKPGRRNTPMNNVKVIDLNAPEGIVAQPGTIQPGNVVTQEDRQEEIGRQREDNTILEDAAPEAAPALTPEQTKAMKKRIGKLIGLAKQMVITKHKQTQDSWGNLIQGDPIAPGDVILGLMGQVGNIGIPDFDTNWWVDYYQEALDEGGPSALADSLNNAPTLWNEYFNELV